MENKNAAYWIITFIALSIVVGLVITYLSLSKTTKNSVDVIVPDVEKQSEPEKTDFGSEIPNDFPTDIPIEEGAEVEQSYSLNYTGQNQLTIVFASTKTVKENYALYADFLEKKEWNISNKYESEKLSSLYGTKENNDINITISEDTETGSKSQVSISVLKK